MKPLRIYFSVGLSLLISINLTGAMAQGPLPQTSPYIEILKSKNPLDQGLEGLFFHYTIEDRKSCDFDVTSSEPRKPSSARPRLVFTGVRNQAKGQLVAHRDALLQGAIQGKYRLLLEDEPAFQPDGLVILMRELGVRELPDSIDGLEGVVPHALLVTARIHDALGLIDESQTRAPFIVLDRQPGEIVAIRPEALLGETHLPNPVVMKKMQEVYHQTQNLERSFVVESVRNSFLRSHLLRLAKSQGHDPDVRLVAVELAASVENLMAMPRSVQKDEPITVPLNVQPFTLQRVLQKIWISEVRESFLQLQQNKVSGPDAKHLLFDPKQFVGLDQSPSADFADQEAALGFDAGVLVRFWRDFSAANVIRRHYCESLKSGKDLYVFVREERVPRLASFLRAPQPDDTMISTVSSRQPRQRAKGDYSPSSK